MSLSHRELEHILRELQRLAGSFVQKIQLASPERLFLDLRQPGRTSRLFVCVEPGRTRLHLAEAREPSPTKPPSFQGLLRARLLGAQLVRLSQLPGDRVIQLDFRASARAAAGADFEELRLVAELTGRSGNLWLLDASGRLLGSALPAAAHRALKIGAPYAPPPLPSKPAGSVASRFPESADLERLSDAIAAHYESAERRARAERARQEALAPLLARRKKLIRALEKARADLAKTENADAFRRRGELLKANAARLEKGQSSAVLVEYTAQGALETLVQLEAALTPQAQIDKAFRTYRRLSNGRLKASARVEELEGALREIEAGVAALQLDVRPPAGEGADAARRPTAPASAKPPESKALPHREYRSLAGQRIWVGKSAKHNDALTFRQAKGNDLWFHARGVPGSHVIVPLARDEALSEETRRDALQLALHFSNARGERAEVSWTRVKCVRKQKGGAPGAVVYSQEKTALVRPEADRLARLLGAGT